MDRQLRDLLEAAVGEPPHRVTVEAVRRRVVRRRVTDGMVAASAALVLAGLGVAVSALATGPSPVGATPAGVPRFYIQQTFTETGLSATLVRATATGGVTAIVRCPGPQSRIALEGVAAAARQTFFVACGTTTGKGALYTVTRTRIYRFRITGAGQVTGWSLIPGGVLDGLWVYSLAASPDGSELAVSGTELAAPRYLVEDIVVVNARTGTRATWRNDTRGHRVIGNIRSLSLTSDGRELVFVGTPGCVSVASCLGPPDQVRALSPATKGGLLDSGRVHLREHPASGSYLDQVVISPDGSALTVVRVISPDRGPDSLAVVQVSAVTGQQIRVLYQLATSKVFSFAFFSSDPSGRYLLIDVGPASRAVNGWIDHGRLVPLTPAGGQGVLDETW